jgi:hypothetical protein
VLETLYPHVNCSTWDWLEAVQAELNTLFVTTHVHDEVEQRQCDCWEQCKKDQVWKEMGEVGLKEYYVENAENFLLVFEHALHSQEFGHEHTVTNREMDGVLLKGGEQSRGVRELIRGGLPDATQDSGGGMGSASGEVLQRLDKGHRDWLSLDMLLHSAGVELEHKSDSTAAMGFQRDHREFNETYRERGMELQLHIVYSNLWSGPSKPWLGTGPMRYAMYAQRIPKTEANRVSMLPVTDHMVADYNPGISEGDIATGRNTRPRRLKRTQFGVKVNVRFSGVIARWSWSATIHFLVGWSALSALAFSIMEALLSVYPALLAMAPLQNRAAPPRWHRLLYKKDATAKLL